MKQKLFLGLVLALMTMPLAAEDKKESSAGKILYKNDFEQAELEKIPSDFLVIEGGFAVKQDGTNRLLELPGAPLETFGMLFGPTVQSDVEVSARFRSTAKGRRFPTFALGLNGVGGYKLQVSPAKKAVELFRGDELVASAPFDEKMGSWIKLRLQISRIFDGQWNLAGYVWPEDSIEPKQPLILFNEKTKPVAGRASIWGSPYSGMPVQFDDLKVTSLEAK